MNAIRNLALIIAGAIAVIAAKAHLDLRAGQEFPIPARNVPMARTNRPNSHRVSAANCQLWIGDRYSVDLGTCPRCPE